MILTKKTQKYSLETLDKRTVIRFFDNSKIQAHLAPKNTLEGLLL